VIKGIFGSG